MLSKVFRLNVQTSTLFICDMQEKFRPLIHRFPSILNKVALLAEISNLLEIPKVISEQYPQALGATVPELNSIVQSPNTYTYSKKLFSMMTPGIETAVSNRNQIILCGIESHVCISQTAFDLLDQGYQVFVICDAVSSQRFASFFRLTLYTLLLLLLLLLLFI
jgi:nicotinamidase-related amidase